MNAHAEVKQRTGVIAAIAAAAGEVKRVAKDSRNIEQKYDFASIDDFMAMVGPICAKHGLVTILDEDQIEFVSKAGKYGDTLWVRVAYQITTYHASGEAMPTVRRNVEVIRSGPQAYGAAQSYVLKQYYRGLFAIPTGDNDDPDTGAVQPEPAKTRDEPKADPAEAIDRACDYLAEADTLSDLQSRWENVPRAVRADARVIAAKDAAKARLAQPASADLGASGIPY